MNKNFYSATMLVNFINHKHLIEEFKEKSMHIDGIKEICNVQGYQVMLKESSQSNEGEVISYDDAKKL